MKFGIGGFYGKIAELFKLYFRTDDSDDLFT